MSVKSKYSVFAVLLLVFSSVQAQIDRNFTSRFSVDTNGGIELIGNVLITCDEATTTDCADRQSGTVNGNNNIQTRYVNEDVPGGFTNSSSATLTLPAGSNVLYAGLYWGGRFADSGGGSNARRTINIKPPLAGSYSSINVGAGNLDDFSTQGSAGNRPYQVWADITTMVQTNGSGVYFVGGLSANNGADGLGFYGGWSIVVVYEDSTLPFRRLALYDGAARVTGTTPVAVTIGGLLTPASGDVTASVGALVWEGDQNISGDRFRFEGTDLFTTGINPVDNFWNSSITKSGAQITNKTPNYVNQLGMDVDFHDIPLAIWGNSEIEANIEFQTNGDSYYPNYLTFVTDLNVPDFSSSLTKTATDDNGGDIGRNDVITYDISFTNDGSDDAINTVVTDPIPANMTYVPNSLEIVSADAGPTGSLTDTVGDDAAEYDSGNDQVVFRVGLNADNSNGGEIAPGEQVVVRFQAQIDAAAPTGDIDNIVTINSNSTQLPTTDFTFQDTATVTLNDITPPTIGTCTVTPDPANNGTAVTANCTGVEAGATLTIPGYACTDNGSGNWSCTGTVGTAGVDGDETATATDAAGNTATTPANFTLDNTPPSIGTCTVTPDPANNGTAVTANCTGVEGGATLTIPGYACTDNGSGNWSCTGTVGTAGVDGDETATATDAAGNTATTPANFTLDNTPPAIGTCTVTPDPANNGTAVTANCTGVEAGATLTIPGYACTDNGSGNWSCTGTVGTAGVDGDETATATDAAGNTATTPANFTLDNTPPAIGTCTVTPDPANNGTAVTANCTGVEAGATLTIPGYACTDNGSGNWSCTGTVGTAGVDGDETATATDAAGNTATTPANFTLDNTPPSIGTCTVTPDPANNGTAVTANCTGVEGGATLTIPGYACTDNGSGNWSCTGTVGTAGVDGDETATATDAAGNTATTPATFTLDNTPPTIGTCTVTPDPANNGTAVTANCTGVEAGATLTIPGYACTDNGSGNWSCTGTVGTAGVDGDETATATDTAGNTATTPANFTLDNTPPAIGTCTVTPDPANNGTAVTANCTGVEAGATLTIPGYACTDNGSGNWSCTGTVGTAGVDGDETATATDTAGNTATTPATFTLDNTPPTIGTCTVTPDPANNGTAVTANCTGVEAGATLTIPGYACTDNGSGNWSCTGTVGTAGVDGDETATATDAAGNTATTPANFTLDNTPPSIGTCTVTPDPANNGTAVTANCTGVEAGSTLTIPGYACTDNGSGNWSCTGTVGTAGVDGDETATATDAAGNTATTPATFTLDNTPPTIGTCTVTPDPANNGTAVTANCTGVEAGATLTIPGYACTDNGSGNWSCTGTVGTAGVDGDETATATDAAGNTATTPANFTLDNDAPPAPVINAPTTGAPVTGTGEPGATVTVTTPSGATCTATVQLDGTWSCTLSPTPVDGEDITATQEDAAGNTSPPTTVAGGIDLSAPAAPTVVSQTTNNPTPVLNGTAEADSTVTIVVGGATYTTTADGSGNWSLDLASATPDSGTLNLDLNGVNDVTVTATDAAGNTSPPDATSGELVLDTTAPTAPTIDPVDENTNPVTGLAEPGALITLSGIVCDNAPVFADVNGVWSCDVTTSAPLVPGTLITATATDAAGNESGPTSTTVADSATQSVSPTIDPVADGATEITGSAVPDSTIDLAGITCSNAPVTADASGNWVCDSPSPVPATGNVISATATQSGLLASPPVTTTVFDPNVTAPPAPQVNPTDGDPVTGTTIPNGDITVLDNQGNVLCATTADAAGNFSCSPVIPAPAHNDVLSVFVTDDNGNSSLPTEVTVDAQAPAAPTVVSQTTNNPTPVLNGTAEADSTVTIVVGGATYTTTADGSGNWSLDLASATPDSGTLNLDLNGVNDVTVTATDAAGNTSPPDATSGELVLDTTAPTAPTIDPVDENTNPVTGLAEPGALITLSGIVCDNAPVFADVNGVWSCDVTTSAPLVPGTLITATATDAAGNESGPTSTTVADSATQSVSPTIDPVADGATEITGSAVPDSTIDLAGITCSNAPVTADASGNWVCDSPSPVPATGNVISATATQSGLLASPPVTTTVFDPNVTAPPAPQVNPTDGDPVTGTTIPNGDITVLDNQGNVLCTTTADAAGNFSCSPVIPAPAHNDVLSVFVTDDNGNSSLPTEVTVDAQAPAAPTVVSQTTNNPTPVLNGTAEADSTVTIVVGGATYTTTADGSGNWSLDLASATPDSGTLNLDLNGVNDVTVTATDAAGNTSPPDATSGELVLDTTAPTAPTIDPVDENTNPVTGLAEPGALITLSGIVCDNAPVFADVNGVWSCDVTTSAPLVPGTLITATATDAAGNESGPTSTTVADSATQSVSPTIDPVADGATEITGSAVPDSTIDLAGITCSNAPVTVDASGNWVCDSPSPVPATGNVISATATQSGLLASPPVTTTVFDPNVTAPPAPQVNPTDGDPVTGTTIPNGDITVLDNQGNVLCTTTADAAGNFSCSPVIPAPAHNDVLSVFVTDDNGNSSLPTEVTVDAQAPAAPVITAPLDGAITNINDPVVVGTAEPFSTVDVTGPLGESCTVQADVNGDWSCQISPALQDGSNQLTATATDEVGNTSPASTVTIEVDTLPPLAPVINVPTNGAPVTGTGEPGATVTVTTPSGSTCMALVQPDGTWSCTLVGPPVDGEDITADQTDPAGNTSPPTTEVGGIDTTPPAAPVCTVTPDPAGNGTPVTATCTGVETDATLTIPGYSCGLESGNVVICNATAGQNGVDGDEVATIQDVAGNTNTTPASFTFDDTVPNPPTINDPSNGLTVSGTGEIGATVNVSTTSGASCSALVDGSGNWTCDLSPEPVDGETATATQTDTANNVSGPATATVAYRPDLTIFFTNCVKGVDQNEQLLYELTINNSGNIDINGALINATLSPNISTPDWICMETGGASCDDNAGTGDVVNELVNLPVGSQLVYLFDSTVTGSLFDFIDVQSSVDMPAGTTDVNLLNNVAEDSDLIYQFVFKDTFECDLPGTIGSTTRQLESFLN